MRPTNMQDVLNHRISRSLFVLFFFTVYFSVFWNTTFSTLPEVFIMKHMQIFIYTQRRTLLLHTSQKHAQQVMQGMYVKCYHLCFM